jgi:ParB-like chromosome segregation protein Spo0J
MTDIFWIAIDKLTPNGRNARTHSRKQIRQIADSIAAFRFVVPILTDDDNVIIAGHGRYAAAKLLGLKEVRAIKLRGLSEAKRRALALADNRIAENAGWDRELLAIELPALAEILVVEGSMSRSPVFRRPRSTSSRWTSRRILPIRMTRWIPRGQRPLQ